MKKVNIVLFSLCISSIAMSQDAELKARIDTLQQQLLDLRKVAESALTGQRQQPAGSAVVMSGNVFANYSYSPNGGTDWPSMNKFDLDRVYLTAKSNLSEEWKAQVTTDVYRTSSIGSTTYYNGLAIRLKYALVEYAPAPSVSIKAGMIPTVWTSISELYWKYRGIAKVPTDKSSYFSTSDLGISGTYLLPNKLGEVSAFILNGNGYDNPDTNRYKDFGARAVLNPFSDESVLKSLAIAGYGYVGTSGGPGGPALPRNRIGGIVACSYSIVSANIEFDSRKDAPATPNTTVTGSLWSVFGEVRSPWDAWLSKFAAVWRVDFVDPNVNVSGDKTRFVIGGLAYKVNDKVTLALDEQATYAETKTLTRYDKSKTDYDSKICIHSIIIL